MKRTTLLLLGLVATTTTATRASAEPVTLRMASVAPEGSSWAREVHAFSREVEMATHDNVHIKWYLGGIAGDELSQLERVRRDQLDGVISGGMLCEQLAPSLRAAALAGEFRDRDEAVFVVNRLRPQVDDELLKAGMVNLCDAGMGFSLIFSKTPVRTLADLKAVKPWLWSLDDALDKQLLSMGLSPVMLPIETAGHAYDGGQVDAFIAIPSAALAFQWSTQAKYVTELRVGYLVGCMLMARKAWDTIATEDREQIRSAAAKVQARMETMNRQMDEKLMHGLFARQGVQTVPLSRNLQAEFSQAARAAQHVVGDLIPPGVTEQVAAWLAEYRGHHAPRP